MWKSMRVSKSVNAPSSTKLARGPAAAQQARPPRAVAFVVAGFFGVGVAIEARVNGELSARTSVGLFPAWLETVSALTLASTIVLLHPRTRNSLAQIKAKVTSGELPRIALAGGLFGAIYLTMQSVTVPLIGVSVFAVGLIAGQTIGSLIVDRFGFSGSQVQLITWQRGLAGLLAVTAVAVGMIDRFQVVGAALLGALLAFIAGFVIAPQQALNGRVADSVKSPFALAFINFLGATIVMQLVGLSALLLDSTRLSNPFVAPWWAYTGGVFGFFLISAAAWVVPSIGVLRFTLLSILGSIGGALIADIFLPIGNTQIGLNLALSLMIIVLAIILAGTRG